MKLKSVRHSPHWRLKEAATEMYKLLETIKIAALTV
jgi:hypothetical protein